MVAESLTNNLDLDIDLKKAFTQDIDLDQTRINGTMETAELGDQADITLRHRFVGVRTKDTTWNSTHSSYALAQRVD
jgi:hypothetical protein